MWLGQYILEGKKPVPCYDTMQWAMWLETHRDERRVAFTPLGDCFVSTVFLGLDHGFGWGPPLQKPILFETMAFGPEAQGKYRGKPYTYRPEICSMNRYSTWDEAEAGHREILAEVQNYLLDTAVKAEEGIMAIAAKT